MKEKDTLIRIYLPKAQDNETSVSPDQTENVTVNGAVLQIRRGEYVSVTPEVFTLLRLRYPTL